MAESTNVRNRHISGGIYLLGAEIGSRFVAFSVTFVVAHRLGLRAVALIGLAQSLISFATIAGDAGLGSAGVTRIAQGDRREEVVRDTARLQVWAALSATALLSPVIVHRVGWEFVFAVALLPVGTAASATYVLIGEQKHGLLAVARSLGNLAVGVVGVAVALTVGSPAVVAVAYAAGSLVTMALVNYWSHVPLSSVLSPPSFSQFRNWGSKNAWLVALAVSTQAASVAAMVGAGALAGGRHLDVVGVASRVLVLALIPAGIIRTVLLPRYSQSNTLRDTVREAAVLGAVGLVEVGVILLTAPVVMPALFGSEVHAALPAIYLSLPGVPAGFFGSVLLSFLMARYQYRYAVASYVVGVISSAVWLVVFEGYSSGVFVCASWVGEIVTTVLMFVFCVRCARSATVSV